MLVGENNITNTHSSGTVIEIDHSSSMLQLPGVEFGYSNETENISGVGLVQEQSSMDLGQGLFGSSSSLELEHGHRGGISRSAEFVVPPVGRRRHQRVYHDLSKARTPSSILTTAAPSSNQTVSGRHHLPFTTLPDSHVAAPTKVTPNVTMATSFAAATTPQCLPF